MCLLIIQKAETKFDREDIVDFYRRNDDGIGVMWSEDNTLRVQKMIPKTQNDAWEFYNEFIAGKDCVWHLRMKTHGHIDIDNCHPYEVFGDNSPMPLYMAHNGVLACGNVSDVRKSDTWHYIETYVKPVLARNPELIFNPAFLALLQSHVGYNNKLVFMNHEGRLAATNLDAFVKYKGSELSNTYAWTSSRGGFGYQAGGFQGYSGGQGKYKPYGHWDDLEYDFETKDYKPRGAAKSALPAPTVSSPTPASASGGPVNSSKPAFNQSSMVVDPEDDLTAGEFFAMLRDEGFQRAYTALNYTDITTASTECGITIWMEFCHFVRHSSILDETIIKCVQDTNYLLDVLYNDEYKIMATGEVVHIPTAVINGVAPMTLAEEIQAEIDETITPPTTVTSPTGNVYNLPVPALLQAPPVVIEPKEPLLQVGL